MERKKWAIVGTAETTIRLVGLCGKMGVEAEGYPAVAPAVNPQIAMQLARLGPLDTSVFTSRRAVELVHEHAPKTLRSEISRSTVYAIGPSTAARVRELFGADPHVPATYSSEGLAATLAGRNLGRTALFSSTARSDRLVAVLKQHSTLLVEPKLYTLGLDSAHAKRFQEGLAACRFKGVVFTCSTATQTLRGLRGVGGVVMVAMGERTLGALRAAGYDAQIPAKSTLEEVVKLIVRLEQLDSGPKV